MFNFFKKKEGVSQVEPQVVEETEEEYPFGAQLIYFVDEGEPKVDISVPDFTPESIENLTILLAGISGSVYFTPTLELVKEGMIEAGKSEELLKMLNILQILQLTKHSTGSKDKKEEPCIKPKDVL